MAHWAEIDENNIVIRVVVTPNEEQDEGYQWLMDNLGGRWVKTSYNSYGGIHYLPDNIRDEQNKKVPSGETHLRYNFAGIGFMYNETLDAFIAPKPEIPGNWVLDESTCLWQLNSL